MIFSKITSKFSVGSEDNSILALDIGTEFIKAVIAKVNGDRLEVIGVGKARQKYSSMHSGAIADIAAVVRCAEDALIEAEDQAGFQAKRVVIGLAGELVKGNTSTIKYRRPLSDKPLDMQEIELIISKVQDMARDRARRQIGFEIGNDSVEVKLINSAIVSLHIDGYKVSNPLGFQGKDVAVQIYTAFAPMVHIGALERVTDELGLELMAVAAEPFAVSRAMVGSDASSSFTAVLIDIGGGTTDIAVVSDGGVEGTRMFGIGGRSFTRVLERDLNLSYDDAEKIKINLSNENLPEVVEDGANQALTKVVDTWLSGVELGLEDFDAVDNLPTQVLLCGGGASLHRLVESLTEGDWYKDLSFTTKPTVRYISAEDVVGVENKTKNVIDHTFITAFGLLRVGYDTIIGISDSDNIKDKLNRMFRI